MHAKLCILNEACCAQKPFNHLELLESSQAG